MHWPILLCLLGDFEPLFPGDSLEGWTVYGGEASYAMSDGILTGEGSPAKNAFLVSPRDWGDFVLEVDVRIEKGNSGIQIRSRTEDGPGGGPRMGRVVGYQIEIDPSERAWSGGLYDEGRAGWLDDLSESEAARKAFVAADWNRYRIECAGPRIRTWVNGVPCADFDKAADLSGRIAFQVHTGGCKVMWRNARIDTGVPARRVTEEERAKTLAARAMDAARPSTERIDSLRELLSLPESARAGLSLPPIDTVHLVCVPDRMAWDSKEVSCTVGAFVRFVLENPDTVGHTLVLAEPGTLAEVGAQGDLMGATPEGRGRGFVPDSPKVLASTGIVEPGATGETWWIAPATPGAFPLFSTYPGQWRTMNATLRVSSQSK